MRVVAAAPSPVAGYVVAIPRYGQRCELRPTPDNFPVGWLFQGQLRWIAWAALSLCPSTWCFPNVSIFHNLEMILGSNRSEKAVRRVPSTAKFQHVYVYLRKVL